MSQSSDSPSLSEAQLAAPNDLLEISVPGVYAAGDVRAGSTKRCATAVGEGAMAVHFVHAHIARQRAAIGQ